MRIAEQLCVCVCVVSNSWCKCRPHTDRVVFTGFNYSNIDLSDKSFRSFDVNNDESVLHKNSFNE